MRKLALIAAFAVAVLGLTLPGSASALLNLDIGFDPQEACPGDDAQFFFALENIGAAAEDVELSVTLEFAGEEYGPFVGNFELAAGEEITKELLFTIPMMAPPGMLTVYVTATDSGGSVDDTASLEILECRGAGTQTSPKRLIGTFRKALGSIGIR